VVAVAGGGISKKYNSMLGYQHWNLMIIKEVSSSSAQMKTEFFLTLPFVKCYYFNKSSTILFTASLP
jgi:hypothetical protein